MQKVNRNYLAKTYKRILNSNPTLDQDETQRIFQQQYQQNLESAYKDLTRKKTREFYQNIKKATKLAGQTRALDVVNGPLLGQYSPDLKDKTLRSTDEIQQEIDAWVKDHFSSTDPALSLPRGKLIEVKHEEILSLLSHFRGGKDISVDAIPDTSFAQQTVEKVALDLLHFQPPIPKEDRQVIKETMETLTQQISRNLATLYNKWLGDKFIPIVHMTSRLLFLLKKDPRPEGNTLDDYRPISVTSFIFKLLEKIIQRRIQEAESNLIITPFCREQIGFQKGLGCEINILKIQTDAMAAL